MAEWTGSGSRSDGAPALQLSGVTKSFPGVKALDGVSLTLRPGEVHALLGENGAGKSTLIKIISGVYAADAGTYLVDGKPAAIATPRQALQRGIGVVHQERSLVPTFTAGENVLLERVVGKALRRIDTRTLHREAQPYLAMVGLDIPPESRVEALSPAQKQLIEIARALSLDTRILLLDEPTASISLNEADTLLATIRRLRDRGVAILYVSHKLEEVFQVCDTVTVLRDGRTVAEAMPLGRLDRDRLIALMIGRAHANAPLPARTADERAIVLEARGLAGAHSPVPASFALGRGEILGWYGLVGAGRTELARTVIAADPPRAGNLAMGGLTVRAASPADACTGCASAT